MECFFMVLKKIFLPPFLYIISYRIGKEDRGEEDGMGGIEGGSCGGAPPMLQQTDKCSLQCCQRLARLLCMSSPKIRPLGPILSFLKIKPRKLVFQGKTQRYTAGIFKNR